MFDRLNRTKNELEYEFMLNEDNINKLKEKREILWKTTLLGKCDIFTKMIGLSLVIAITGLFIVGVVITPVNGIAIGPVELLKNIAIGSVISGFALERIISKVNNKKLNRFSSAKTEEQKREEIYENKLETAKLKDKNESIKQAYDVTNNLANNLSVLTPNFVNSNMTQEEQLKNNRKLLEEKNDKESELEVLSTQKFLNEEFSIFRSKAFHRLNIIGIPILIGVMVGMCSGVYAVAFYPISLHTTILASGFAIGTVIGAIGTYLSENIDRRIFNRMNNKLGENRLPLVTQDYNDELSNILDNIDTKTDEISRIHLAYQDSKRELENMAVAEKDNITIDSSTTKEMTNALEESYDIPVYTVSEDESTKKVEGPTLVKR